MENDWTCLPRVYKVNKNCLPSVVTTEHPLKIPFVTVLESKGTRGNLRSNVSNRTSSNLSLLADPLGFALDGTDPLSEFIKHDYDLTDPLSSIVTDENNLPLNKKQNENPIMEDDYMIWNAQREDILNKFQSLDVPDKITKQRLEQLNQADSNMTQQEYVQQIEQLHQELIEAWNNEHRIKSLKIAIHCAKMLNDTSVLTFYPSQFVLITDMLDNFGKLVYERLKEKSSMSDEKSVPNVNIKNDNKDEGEIVAEICTNWYSKVNAIRELVPRVYIEMALLKSFQYLPNSQVDEMLLRLADMITGINDPLVHIYARCYLLRVGLSVSNSTQYMICNFDKFISSYTLIFSGTTYSELLRQRVDIGKYLMLYSPALDFIVKLLMKRKCITIAGFLKKCSEFENNTLLLFSIINTLPLDIIASYVSEFVTLLSKSDTEGIPKGQLMKVLGNAVSQYPPKKEERGQLLESAFRAIDALQNDVEFLMSVESWTQYIVQYYTMTTLNSFLGKLHKRMSLNKSIENHYNQLKSILNTILANCKQFDLLLAQENFLPYLNLFQKDFVRINVCKQLLTTYNTASTKTTEDELVINTLMYIAGILNDYVTAMTVEDERRQIGELISCFIRKVKFERDYERQLSFYVRARGEFCNLDSVYITLVFEVNHLSYSVRCLDINKERSQKVILLARACMAYCLITIPSIRAVQTQMDLYLLTGQMALLNQCLGQAQAALESALLLTTELPYCMHMKHKSQFMETYIVSFMCKMLSTLFLVPDSPDQGVLYLLRLLMDVVNKFPFDVNKPTRTVIYLYALDILYIQSMEHFPCHLPAVISNDELYGHDAKFVAEVNKLCCQVLEEIVGQINHLGTLQQHKHQCELSLQLFIKIVRYADLKKNHTFQMARNLLILIKRSKVYMDVALMNRVLLYVEKTYKGVKDINNKRALQISQLLQEIKQ